ncbi:hypothetical protein PSA01_49820 [Pseudonocardia saturnea]|uniref:Uncharacterized protein n=1 Tax=Pseudonocardia saturnea TaxID=33909 RepID=A0ABQ0S4V5_9PSEU|nr:hypothetical protein Pdca_62670 [Pseudonocardia autotrophica]GEC27953.1 hypothetical protein PSA01_49820 [Pseudonocardia saturnea]
MAVGTPVVVVAETPAGVVHSDRSGGVRSTGTCELVNDIAEVNPPGGPASRIGSDPVVTISPGRIEVPPRPCPLRPHLLQPRLLWPRSAASPRLPAVAPRHIR